jgi:hypothetical protein
MKPLNAGAVMSYAALHLSMCLSMCLSIIRGKQSCETGGEFFGAHGFGQVRIGMFISDRGGSLLI